MANIWDDLEKQSLEAAAKDSGVNVWDQLEQEALGLGPKPQTGFISDIKRGTGQIISGAGSTLRDLGAEDTGAAIEGYGEGIQRRNASQINSFDDVIDKPFTTAREAVGEVIPQVAGVAGGAIAGRVIGGALGSLAGPAGTAIGATAGGFVGSLLTTGASTYGGIRADQREAGQEDIGRAIATAIPAMALDRFSGAERIAGKVVGKGTNFLARESGESLTGSVARQFIRGGIEEGIVEVPQTALERLGSFKDLTSPEALDEYAVSGAKGFLGGGAVRAGLSSVSGVRETGNGGPLTDPNAFSSSTSPENAAISGAINENNNTVPVGPPPQSASFGPNIPEQVGPVAPSPSQQAADAAQLEVQRQQQVQVQAAEQAKQADVARGEVFTKYGGVQTTIPNGTKPMWQYLGKNYFTKESLDKAVDQQVAKEAAKPELVRQVENALTQTYEAVAAKPYTPGKMASFVAPFTQQAESIEEVVGRIEAEILNSKENTPQNDTLKALRNVLLGKPVGAAFGDATPAPEQKSATAEKLDNAFAVIRDGVEVPIQVVAERLGQGKSGEREVVALVDGQEQNIPISQIVRKQGVQDGQLQVQNTAGLGNVSVQGSTTEGSGTVTGDVRPNEVRSLGSGSNALLTNPEQDVELGTEGTQPVADGSGISDADVLSDREEARAQVRKIFTELIGNDRDAGILMDLQDTDTFESQQQVAKKYGVNQSTVSRLTKLLKSDTLGPRFLLAAKKLGISKDEVVYLIAQIEDTGLDQDVNEDVVDDTADLVNNQASDALPNTNSDDINPKFSDEADVSKLGNEEVFGNEEDGAGGYAILDSVAGTKLSDASEANKTATKYKKEGSNWSKYEDFEIQNLIADGIAKKSDIPGILEEVKRREAVRVGKDAPAPEKTETKVTKKATKKVVEKPAVEAKPEPVVAKTSAEAAADAWDAVASKIPDAPLFEELTEEQQSDFISFGPDNWSAADVNTELNKLAESPKFSTAAKKVANAWNASELIKSLKATFATDESFKDLVTIVDVFEELPADIQTESKKQRADSSGIKGIAYKGKVYLIASQIAKGQELGVMLHELGAHVGMKNLIGEYNYKKIIDQLEAWAAGKGVAPNSIEKMIVDRAYARIPEGTTSSAVRRDELLAYFVEEAVLAGINPTATNVSSNQIVQMLRSMLAAMRLALRKIGFAKFDSLSASDFVDLAFGAAKMELDGTYHGTKGEFRKFLDDKISNVLNGWGHYNTNDKTESKTYGEQTIRSLFVGDRKDLIQNDRPLEDQADVLKKLRAVADVDFQEFLTGLGVQIDGGDLQESLGEYEVDTAGGLYKLLSKDAQDRVVDVKEIVSAFLTEQGIPGSTFKPYGRGAPNRQTIVFQGKDLARVSQETEDGLKFSIAAARKETQTRIDRMPKAYRGTVQKMFDFLTTKNLSVRTLANFAFTRDVTDAAAKAGLKSAQTFQRLSDARKQILGSYSSRIEAILEDFNKLTDSVLKSTGPSSINGFLKDSTTDGLWGFQPDWLPKPVVVDPGMEARFNAIEKQSPKAAAIIKGVFKYNYDVNQAMKKAVIDSISSEFDAMIAQAKADGDIKEEADLLKKKAAGISEYQTLLAIRNEKPYAALRRFGNIVVVGKSQAYLDAEDANDTAEIRKLETDENHYVVRFAETNSEAQAIYRSMQGKFEYLTEPFDSADADASVYGGRDMNALFYRLRNAANSEEGSDAASKGMKRMMNDLHLKLLSEQSVRQSENRRKNITGADDDMMRAFVSQGRAAAHFVSSLTNSAGIYDSLRDMRKERDARTPGKDVRAIYYNEIMARHGMEMEYKPTPFVDAALNVTSTWMLLTSPGYYFQNITQPFLISLPYMGANPKFGYNKTVAELLKSYSDVKALVGLGKKGLSEADYNELPADVRNVIEELVNRGSINISLSAELGRFRSGITENPDVADKGMELYNKGTDMLRGFAENIESINRLTTAMTAYRLAVKAGQSNESAIDYADKVIYNTHGDYSGANAPRIMRSGLGRVATQFRKFQLIQISLMARMWHEWRKGATPEERIVAKRQLMFTLGHTFAVGGIMGMPGFTALAFLFGALFGDEDEPDNPELTLRRLIGDPDIADLLVKGVPAFMGVDLSGKLGMGQMLSVLPYTDFKLNRDTATQATVALFGGPFAGGLLPKAMTGAEYLAKGEYYKGIEQLMPKGIGDAMKGVRIADEGLTNKRGDVQLNADEISFMDAFLAGLGLPTTTLTKRQFADNARYEFDEFFKGKTTELKDAYAKAYREGDAQKLSDIRDKWKEIQESRIKNGYSRQPLSTLIKSPMEQRKRERNSAGGVSFDKSNRRFVQDTTGA